ncbi:MAG: dihydropteroate synthase [bacterium]|nr:dihydropteroate synthase [bacterium]
MGSTSNSPHSPSSTQTFIIGLGTNKGNKLLNLRQAIEKIKEDNDIALISTSRIYKTEALLFPNSPKEWDIPYFNGAVKVETSLSAEDLLERLKRIEHQLGRPLQYEKWSPRIIDLDILSCGQTVIDSPTSKTMGVLNLAPISISGPNKLLAVAEIQEIIVQMVNDGAEIIAVGAESTRPGPTAISPETEWKRLEPFVMNLKALLSDSRLLIRPKINIDTYHAETVQKLRDFDIDVINDISGAEAEKEHLIPPLHRFGYYIVGSNVADSPSLTIPHPGLLERNFALTPLLDVEPNWSHPQYPHKDLSLLLENLGSLEVLPYPLEGTKIMGVLNLTPISMSGPNKLLNPEEIQEKIIKMVNEGAEIIDVGAESTRPGATPLSPEKEWERLQPFVMNLKVILSDSRLLIRPKISIDTYHAETVQKLRDFDIDIINDVSGAEKERIIPSLKGTNKKYVLMHNRGKSGTNHMKCSDQETVAQMISWFERQIEELIALGLTKDQIIIDPGVGFGKKRGHTFALVENIARFKQLGYPILVGHSRKLSALPSAAGLPPLERDLATAWLSKEFSKKGIDIVRVHNVPLNRRMMDEKISLMVAYQTDRGMGFEGKLPWLIRADMKHFRETTWGKTILMGRKTFESIGRPLPSRRNMVLSKTLPRATKGVEVFRSLQEAFSNTHPKEEVFVIGGEGIFAETIPHADILYRTIVRAEVPVDVFFPEIREEKWEMVDERPIAQDKENEFPYVIQTLRALG